jgi:hypothetical protein
MIRPLQLLASLLLCLITLAAPVPARAQALAPSAPANPHDAGGGVPQNESRPDPTLPKGTIEAVILNPDQSPVVGSEVRLGVMFQKISEGESRTERFAKTDASGHARFNGLTVASEYSYRVTMKSGPAEYGSLPFNLGETGQRITLYMYPVTRDLGQALIGTRALVYIEPRDEVFAFEVLFRILNIGSVTWVPNNVIVRLPAGFKAVNAQRGMADTVFEPVDGQGVRLTGTFSPGQHDVNFRFQVPKLAEPNADFRMGLLPRVFEIRVIAEASSKMNLAVEGFPQVKADTNQGKPVLFTQRVLKQGDDALEEIHISLEGLPVPGNGRWIAVFIAAGLASIGLLVARGMMELDSSSDPAYDRQQAREILLSELVDVERAQRNGELGPRAYAEARKTLLDALARLGNDVLGATRKKRRRAAA